MNDYFANISGFELLDHKKQRKITRHKTGLKELDVVTYGFPTGTIIDLFGPNSSGKSQILFQTAVNTSIKNKKILFIDSSGNFRPERIIQLSEAKNYDSKLVLDNIYTYRCNSLDKQLETISMIKEFIDNNKITCVMIDDLTRNFTEHQFELKNEMRNILRSYIRELSDLAWNRNIAIITTNTIRARIDNSNLKEHETYDFLINRLIHLKVSLKRMDDIWLARNNDGKQCIFNISKEGIGKV
ncbi:MAG: hypothetical protein CMO19_00175 [Thaumarchaeota archaeon]|nr:hypothetical protein [Nitrososphaerota archaeon]|tara:strand:- start:47606 stop:48331 length:726 start_codon:yes stop_codon:yes gene_type:complete